MFGVITAFIGSLTFLYLIKSINLQREEIEISRKSLDVSNRELELTRGELKLSREEMEKQSKINRLQQKTARLQRIENTFFKLIDLHTSISDSLKQQFSDGNIFKFAIGIRNKSLEAPIDDDGKRFNEHGEWKKINFFKQDLGNFIDIYNKEKDPVSDQYYNQSMNILKYLKDSPISSKKKMFYAKTFIMSISPEERVLLVLYIQLHRKLDGSLIDREFKRFCRDCDAFEDVDMTILTPNPTYSKLKEFD